MNFTFDQEHIDITTYRKEALKQIKSDQMLKNKIKKIEILRIPMQEFSFRENINAFRSFFSDIKDSSTVHYAYHGTSSKNLDSIIFKSFLSPYDSQYYKTNGNIYGKGIYLTSNPGIALQYCKGTGVVIVAAYIYGIKEIYDGKKNYRDIDLESNSLVVNNFAVVLQGSTQVLPLFVIYPSNYPSDTIDINSINLEDIPLGNVPSQEHYELALEIYQENDEHSISILIHIISKFDIEIREETKLNIFNKEVCKSRTIEDLELYEYRDY